MPAISKHRYTSTGKTTALWRVLLLLLVMVGPQLSHALEARPLSPSVVLVLKLVSNTRAQPTTGIVLTNEGMVMVPAAFISPAGEIIVLDGGTDIIKNGRPAVVVDQNTTNGWALISVPGLNRPGITMSTTPLTAESELHLSAFPPAEYIANGLPPLWTGVKLAASQGEHSYSISDETPLPNIAGPILDDCGYLAGLSLANGTPDMKGDIAPMTLFGEKLENTLGSLQVNLNASPCTSDTQKSLATLKKTQPINNPTSRNENNNRDQGLVDPRVYNPLIQRKRLNPFQGKTPKPVPVEKPSIWASVPLWVILFAFIALAALAWKTIYFFRLRRAPVGNNGLEQPKPAYVFNESDEVIKNPRSATRDHPGMPDLDSLPEGCDGVLVVEVHVDSHTRIKRYCVVDTRNIDILVGRDGLDISIPHPDISGSHARLRSDGQTMSLSDMGSATGTYIRNVPCLKGEIMYFEPDDEISLGELQLHFTVLRNNTTQP